MRFIDVGSLKDAVDEQLNKGVCKMAVTNVIDNAETIPMPKPKCKSINDDELLPRMKFVSTAHWVERVGCFECSRCKNAFFKNITPEMCSLISANYIGYCPRCGRKITFIERR